MRRNQGLRRATYWPPGVPCEYELTAVVKAFESIEYVECADGSLELGYEKIAIYDHKSDAGEFHAARQLENGWWASKFGWHIDLDHKTPQAIEYWRNYQLQKWMKRPRKPQ